MSRKRWRAKRPRPIALEHPVKVVTQSGPAQAVVGVRVPPEQIEAARRDGRRELEEDVDAKIDQVRADAAALERCAKILDERPRGCIPLPQVQLTVDVLHAMAEGMRLAADRLPDSRDIPF